MAGSNPNQSTNDETRKKSASVEIICQQSEDTGEVEGEKSTPSLREGSATGACADDCVDLTYDYGDSSPKARRILLLISLVVVAICLLALSLPFWAGHHGNFWPFVAFVAIILLVLTGWITLWWKSNFRPSPQARIKISETGIILNEAWRRELLDRLERSWDDLHSVELVHLAGHPIRWKGSVEERSVGSVGLVLYPDPEQLAQYSHRLLGSQLTLRFKSGGVAAIRLKFLNPSQGEMILNALERWAGPSKFTAPVVTLQKMLLLETDQPESFTQLWQDDLNSHYRATNYVPLRSNHQLQSGRFQVLMEMAAGGMSAVYLARNSDGKKVVLKEAVAPPDIDDQQRKKAREMFEREALLLRKLDHPAIAAVFDHFVEDGRDYLVLEYIPGQTLRQLVKAKGKQSEQSVLDWTKQICQILSYLHGQKPPIVHRDLTPDNMILKADGQLTLVDFGAANEFVGSATGTFIGKQCYMAPEQLRGKASPLSDIYSLGGTMNFLLTAQEPAPLSVSHPRCLVPEISEQMDALVSRLTAFDAAGRLESAEQIRQAINAMAAGQRSGVSLEPATRQDCLPKEKD